MILKYTINTENINLKTFLKQHYFSNRLLIKLKNRNAIFCNGKNVYMDYLLSLNDTITINLDYDEKNENIVPTKMDLNIIAEDDAYIILNKPAGIAIHPSCRHYETSLSNGVKYYFQTIGLNKKIRPVNRLDKDTSGLVVFAKNEYIQECFIQQMKNHSFQKWYVAILDGLLKEKQGIINAPIARKQNSIIERCISPDGDKAITHYKVLKEFKDYSLVEFLLETGRTHQIRVHSKYIGHPIVGDTLYGKASAFIQRQALHAYKIKFAHPISNKPSIYIANIEEDIKKLIY